MHSLSCKKESLTIRHSNLRHFTAKTLQEVFRDMESKPKLAVLSSEDSHYSQQN